MLRFERSATQINSHNSKLGEKKQIAEMYDVLRNKFTIVV